MRPPAPKQGQRVLLERVTFLWKRLNFSWKASIRNLVRYKKRFFMTIFGIGGCMALMLVGFGLKDSIFAIVDIQYDEIQLYDGTVIMEEDASGEETEAVIENMRAEDVVTGAEEGVLMQITVGNGEEWREVYLNIPKDVNLFPQFTVLQDRTSDTKYTLGRQRRCPHGEDGEGAGCIPRRFHHDPDEEKGDREVEVSAVCENYMGHYLYMTPNVYRKLYGEEPEYNSVFYSTKDRITEEAQRVGEDALKLPGTLSVSYTTDLKEQVDNMLAPWTL